MWGVNECVHARVLACLSYARVNIETWLLCLGLGSVLPHLRKLFACQLAKCLGPLDLAWVTFHLEVLVALGAAKVEDLEGQVERGALKGRSDR